MTLVMVRQTTFMIMTINDGTLSPLLTTEGNTQSSKTTTLWHTEENHDYDNYDDYHDDNVDDHNDNSDNGDEKNDPLIHPVLQNFVTPHHSFQEDQDHDNDNDDKHDDNNDDYDNKDDNDRNDQYRDNGHLCVEKGKEATKSMAFPSFSPFSSLSSSFSTLHFSLKFSLSGISNYPEEKFIDQIQRFKTFYTLVCAKGKRQRSRFSVYKPVHQSWAKAQSI